MEGTDKKKKQESGGKSAGLFYRKHFFLSIKTPADLSAEQTLLCMFVCPLLSSCTCVGVPPPRIEWFKDAVPLSKVANTRYKVTTATGLTVRRAQPGDGGIFQCVARNAAGETQAYTHLLVSSELSNTNTHN